MNELKARHVAALQTQDVAGTCREIQGGKMKIKCFNCGKKFVPGNDPRTGVPNGLGFVLRSGRTYNVCSKCVAYRTDEVDAKITALEELAEKFKEAK